MGREEGMRRRDKKWNNKHPFCKILPHLKLMQTPTCLHMRAIRHAPHNVFDLSKVCHAQKWTTFRQRSVLNSRGRKWPRVPVLPPPISSNPLEMEETRPCVKKETPRTVPALSRIRAEQSPYAEGIWEVVPCFPLGSFRLAS